MSGKKQLAGEGWRPSSKKEKPLHKGHAPLGHQPTQGNLDPSNPPQNGSGVPHKPSGEAQKTDNKS
jgi:hypothetical protein